MHQLDITTNLQELDRREGDGITVSLLWSRCDDSVSVAVYDERTTELFEFDVPRDSALDAFHHPYAYAARQGLEVASAPREPVYA